VTPPPGQICVVDDRVFLLGLDQLYREAMKWHERGELLTCARRVAATLGVSPADVPIEGYYGEDEDLAEYLPVDLRAPGGEARPRSGRGHTGRVPASVSHRRGAAGTRRCGRPTDIGMTMGRT